LNQHNLNLFYSISSILFAFLSICVTLLVLLYLPTMTADSALHNITIAVPDGTRVYQNPSEICTPASWMDILLFYIVNYVAHVGTVRLPPGHKLPTPALYALSFFFPLTFFTTAVDCILDCVIFATSPLQKAARAGSLCMVDRGEDEGIIPG
jgi:hypothetical protein